MNADRIVDKPHGMTLVLDLCQDGDSEWFNVFLGWANLKCKNTKDDKKKEEI